MTSANGNISALLTICVGNSPVPGEFHAQRPVTRSFGVLFDLRLNNGVSKQWWGWWFETPSCPLWRHRNDIMTRTLPSMMRSRSDNTFYVICWPFYGNPPVIGGSVIGGFPWSVDSHHKISVLRIFYVFVDVSLNRPNKDLGDVVELLWRH